eukprot:CAMPEP_0170521774 /NCGR_PEP_ID=MMETSP0209-20121228/7147_1 /TAXON_ID=665100 ORGANISM="Litonotus pictus, Strain P1" /NCGR_SAMPLE_ID=MMETSP0209 /ASSEMBLY_ACC=CAM_ASM_000301 /LENGTH=418 /DNA_ID=CAMNT_0010808841 /DNA_START=2682 /DNA_END=3938 /DNA_ORIENTATION=-
MVKVETEKVISKISSSTSGLKILSLEKTYELSSNLFQHRTLKALSSFSLEVNKNEVLVILGENGAGKSTLMSLLTNQISSDQGYAQVGPFTIHSDLYLDQIFLNKMIGVCPQFDLLWEELTVCEHLKYFSILRGIKIESLENTISEMLVSVNLVKEKDFLSTQLSGGMKRRLSLIISTIGNPEVMLLDEPTTGLDPRSKRLVWELIEKLKENKIVIINTHLMDEAEILSNRICVMKKGNIEFIGNIQELRECYWKGIILTINFLNSASSSNENILSTNSSAEQVNLLKGVDVCSNKSKKVDLFIVELKKIFAGCEVMSNPNYNQIRLFIHDNKESNQVLAFEFLNQAILNNTSNTKKKRKSSYEEVHIERKSKDNKRESDFFESFEGLLNEYSDYISDLIVSPPTLEEIYIAINSSNN